MITFDKFKFNALESKDSRLLFSKYTFKNGITISVITNTEFSNFNDGTYEVAFFKKNLPIEIPNKIKKVFKDNIIYRFFLKEIPEEKMDWIIKQIAIL